jgi:HAE1 family hydrophobic/amphiphilic exporter-1
MLAASFIAIFLIPVTFYVVEKLSHRKGKHESVETQVPVPKKLEEELH